MTSKASKSAYLRDWLGLTTERDQLVEDAFTTAFQRVAKGRRLLYETPEEGLVKWVTSEVFDVIGEDLPGKGATSAATAGVAAAAPRPKDVVGKLKAAYKKVVWDVANVVSGRWPTIVARAQNKKKELQASLEADQIQHAQDAAKEAIRRVLGCEDG